ncbi:MAG: acylphosphatase [Candidatus Kariarchaeaceae archaeon]
MKVRGKVQGVFFRVHTRDKARDLGLAGWVKNEPDGSVKLEAVGEASSIESLIEWLHQGPPLAHVRSVDILEERETAAVSEPKFSIIYR